MKQIDPQLENRTQELVKPLAEIRFRDTSRKRSTFDRFINFFKTDEEKLTDQVSFTNPVYLSQEKQHSQQVEEIETELTNKDTNPYETKIVELDLNKAELK